MTPLQGWAERGVIPQRVWRPGGSDGASCAEVSAFQGCQTAGPGFTGAGRSVALCCSSCSPMPMWCDETGSGPGFAGKREWHLVLIRTQRWYKSAVFFSSQEFVMYSSPLLTVLVSKEDAIKEGCSLFKKKKKNHFHGESLQCFMHVKSSP